MSGRALFVVGIVGAVALVAVFMLRLGTTPPRQGLADYQGLGAGAATPAVSGPATAPASATAPVSAPASVTAPATAAVPATAPASATSPGTTVAATPTAPVLRPGDAGGATNRDAEPMVPWVERAPAGDAGKDEYVVGPGSESLLMVAQRMLGDARRVQEVQDANPGLRNTDAIPAGTRLRIPAKSAPKVKLPRRLGSGLY